MGDGNMMGDATPAPVDLQPFCGDGNYAPHLSAPFSDGDWTYATNGHIAVRVPRRKDIPRRSDTPDMERIFRYANESGPGTFCRLGQVELPPHGMRACDDCSGMGRGSGRRRRSQFVCPTCEGSGVEPAYEAALVAGRPVGRELVELLLTLPKVEMDTTTDATGGIAPWRFRFPGGSGLVSPLRAPTSRTIIAEIPLIGTGE